ncbi:glycosyltransferase family 25 protein [Providencia rettgeri]|uniref:glycosyltransferase family 25 protein n=1 Tax=Providencia rettgeri TaxID=587 RepID=UPI000CFF5473|nr:glycosyltransferase family 25 protein [Providencia rettgeri]AVL75496.1 lipooligosaccharide biosynthesis protein LpsA [Providencia rettgeri]
MKKIVISIKNNNELRRSHIESEFKKSSVDFEFFDAVTPEQIATAERETGIDLSSSTLSLGGKGCLLSHIKIWQMAIENKEEYIAVFEDDIYLSPSASVYLSNPNWIPSNIDLVKVEKYSKYFPRFNCKKIKTLDNRVLYELKKCNLGTGGYIISIEAAKKILNRLSKKQNILAIDMEMFTPELNNNVNCFIIEPAICIQDFIFNNSKTTQFPSFILINKTSTNTKKNLLTKLKKEILRISPWPVIKKHILSKKSTYK